MRALTAAILGLLVVPSGALAWGPPETIDRTADVAAPSVAVGQGGPVVAWLVHAKGWAIRASRSGRTFDLRRQSGELGAPLATMDAEGDTLIAYRRRFPDNDRLETRTIRPDGSRSAPMLLSGPGSSAYDPSFLAVPIGAPAAQPVVAWWLRESVPDGPIDYLKMDQATHGVFGYHPSNGAPGDPEGALGLLPDGTITMLDGRFNTAATAMLSPGGTAFGDRVIVAGASGDVGAVAMAAGADGTAVAAWTEYTVPTRVRVSVRPPGGGFGPARTVGEEVDPIQGRQALAAVVLPDGHVRVAWRVSEDQTQRGAVRVATLHSGRPATVTAPGETADLVEMGTDARGRSTILWHDADVRHDDLGIVTRPVSPRGQVGRRTVLAKAGRAPSLAVGADGSAIAAWVTPDRREIRAARQSGR
jgi:hypothetical protein